MSKMDILNEKYRNAIEISGFRRDLCQVRSVGSLLSHLWDCRPNTTICSDVRTLDKLTERALIHGQEFQFPDDDQCSRPCLRLR